MKSTLMAVLAATASLSLSGAAMAQSAPPASPAQGAPAQAAPATQQVEVSEKQLKDFSVVQQEVAAISSTYQGQLQSTNDPNEVAEISQKANQEMVKVVEKSPLSVQEYNQIAMLLQQDKGLQQKYQQMGK
jgi:tRNA(Ile2) C34 agmatinyltransferase TiaS